MNSIFNIHPNKLYLYATNPLEKNEREKRGENILRFLQNIISNYGSKVTDDRKIDNSLIYRMKIKDKSRVSHDVIVCFDPKYALIADTTDSYEKFRLLNIDSQSYELNQDGSNLISRWLFGHLGEDLVLPLKGDQLELINHSDIPPMQDKDWSNNFHASLYPEIHSSIVAYMEKIIRADTNVLELCGGDGTLAHMILSSKSPQSYTLLDRNNDLLDMARSKVQNHIQSGKMTLISCDLSKISLEEIVGKDIDIIIGCGALTRAVISEQCAKNLLEQISQLLKVGSYLVLTGYEYSWIDAHMLNKMGFTVLNSFCQQTNKHLYVAQKL